MHKARSAVTCLASRTNGQLHPTTARTACEAVFSRNMDDSANVTDNTMTPRTTENIRTALVFPIRLQTFLIFPPRYSRYVARDSYSYNSHLVCLIYQQIEHSLSVPAHAEDTVGARCYQETSIWCPGSNTLPVFIFLANSIEVYRIGIRVGPAAELRFLTIFSPCSCRSESIFLKTQCFLTAGAH